MNGRGGEREDEEGEGEVPRGWAEPMGRGGCECGAGLQGPHPRMTDG